MPDERPPSPATAVTIDGLWVEYGSIVALRAIDLTIASGTTVAIIGPNGSGKSTLLSTISGLVKPTRGRVQVDTGERRARGVAHVLQTTIANEALPLTVLETIRMGCYAHRGAFRRLTAGDRSAISDAIDRMKLGDLLKRQLHELSGGQRQRTYVAQGLAQQAGVLLLDEPITGLDLLTQETITRMIDDEAADGRTVILTTHDVGTARLAQQAVVMATDLIAAGPPAEALAPDVLAKAYGGHIHELDDGTLVLDEAHHHDHRFDDQLRG
ncbi:MAG: metal ABC transporter ATP-binding protein [Nitriliruptoraceae bacterium]|nr:metal ABC transporter ATP-binding protein [Nitriliruptoraceae bacterium]